MKIDQCIKNKSYSHYWSISDEKKCCNLYSRKLIPELVNAPCIYDQKIKNNHRGFQLAGVCRGNTGAWTYICCSSVWWYPRAWIQGDFCRWRDSCVVFLLCQKPWNLSDTFNIIWVFVLSRSLYMDKILALDVCLYPFQWHGWNWKEGRLVPAYFTDKTSIIN